METGDFPSTRPDQLRLGDRTVVLRTGTTVAEGAAGRARPGRRGRSCDGLQAPLAEAAERRWQAAQKTQRVGVARARQQFRGRPALDDAAGIEDGDPAAEPG